MSNEVEVWNKVMKAALAVPGVKVKRDKFLIQVSQVQLAAFNL